MTTTLELAREIARQLDAIEPGDIDREQFARLDNLRGEFVELGQKMTEIRDEADDDARAIIDANLEGLTIVIASIDRHAIAIEIGGRA